MLVVGGVAGIAAPSDRASAAERRKEGRRSGERQLPPQDRRLQPRET